ncbi:MAG: GNAT family N-acetyltransferase [Bryobacteraceae bacterium]|nr:GNAT family N-acetyltransferase [Bryobacteraceae bacterium]
MSVKPARSLESFRGDFAGLARLAEASWAENNDQSLRYVEPFLRNLFEYPGATFDLSPAIYENGEAVAFVGGFPRTVRVGPRELRLTANTLLTVSPAHKGKGYGAVVWTEFVKRARSAGYQGTLSFCVDGGPMNGIIAACAQRARVPLHRIWTAQYHARFLRPARAALSPPPEIRVEAFLHAAQALPVEVEIARSWTEAEARWQCRRFGGICVEQDGAVLTGYVMPVIDTPPAQSLIVEDILWNRLDPARRTGLLQSLLDRGAAAGASVAVAPDLQYADWQPFRALGFRPSRRSLHVYLTVWDGDPGPEQARSLYLDLF